MGCSVASSLAALAAITENEWWSNLTVTITPDVSQSGRTTRTTETSLPEYAHRLRLVKSYLIDTLFTKFG